jgi:hypothetical protein
MSPNVEHVKQTIQQLPATEQMELLEWFEEHKRVIDKPIAYEGHEALFLQRLLDKGLISEIVPPMTDEEDDEFEPIEVEGEPLSQMIIRERR